MECLIKFVVFIACLGCAKSSLDACLERDPTMKCVQMQIYKTAKTYLDKTNIELGGGLSIRKDRRAKSMDTKAGSLEKSIMSAESVEERHAALLDYLGNEMRTWWYGASVTWNPRELIKDSARSDTGKFMEEGRGRRRKQMQKLMPYLMAGALKMAMLGVVSLLVTGLIAKKALLAGIASLIISGFVSLRGLLQARKNQQHHKQHWDSVQNYPQGIYDYGQNLEASPSNNAAPMFYTGFVPKV